MAAVKERPAPVTDKAYKVLARRPRNGYTVSEFAEAMGMSAAAANMVLLRLRDRGKAMVVGTVQPKNSSGTLTRRANVWRVA